MPTPDEGNWIRQYRDEAEWTLMREEPVTYCVYKWLEMEAVYEATTVFEKGNHWDVGAGCVLMSPPRWKATPKAWGVQTKKGWERCLARLVELGLIKTAAARKGGRALATVVQLTEYAARQGKDPYELPEGGIVARSKDGTSRSKTGTKTGTKKRAIKPEQSQSTKVVEGSKTGTKTGTKKRAIKEYKKRPPIGGASNKKEPGRERERARGVSPAMSWELGPALYRELWRSMFGGAEPNPPASAVSRLVSLSQAMTPEQVEETLRRYFSDPFWGRKHRWSLPTLVSNWDRFRGDLRVDIPAELSTAPTVPVPELEPDWRPREPTVPEQRSARDVALEDSLSSLMGPEWAAEYCQGMALVEGSDGVAVICGDEIRALILERNFSRSVGIAVAEVLGIDDDVPLTFGVRT